MANKDGVRQELGRLLASRVFQARKQACNFLEYVVTEKLEGRGGRITQYGIAIEALGKAADYCPTESPAVRVEAGRVRKLLEEYYLSEGQNSRLRIRLPVGSYEPVFESSSRPPEPVLQGIDAKSIQSLGPRIYIHCQNPTLVRDDTLRGLIYSIRSTLPVTLGQFHEIRIALGAPGLVQAFQSDAIDYAWHQQQAEFLLQCVAECEQEGFSVRVVLIHTLTRALVWSDSLLLPQSYTPQVLEDAFGRVFMDAFSLHGGGALLFWSRYWKAQEHMPGHYRVLVEHVSFIQDQIGHADLQLFLQACRSRTQQYHDDALAHLHYAILCLYAFMLGQDVGVPLGGLWNRLAVQALELNPGNALAHGIFALECFYRGDAETGQVEIEMARYVNSFDCAGGYLLAVGLCAMGHWEKATVLLQSISSLNSSRPDPLRAIPCLFFFRRGEYVRLAKAAGDFQVPGGWETYGKMAGDCRKGNCKDCIRTLGSELDKIKQPLDKLWESSWQSLSASSQDDKSDMAY